MPSAIDYTAHVEFKDAIYYITYDVKKVDFYTLPKTVDFIVDTSMCIAVPIKGIQLKVAYSTSPQNADEKVDREQILAIRDKIMKRNAMLHGSIMELITQDTITDSDDAIWRRMRVVPFNSDFEPAPSVLPLNTNQVPPSLSQLSSDIPLQQPHSVVSSKGSQAQLISQIVRETVNYARDFPSHPDFGITHTAKAKGKIYQYIRNSINPNIPEDDAIIVEIARCVADLL